MPPRESSGLRDWRLWFALGIVPGGALVGLDRAFHMLSHMRIWAAYGNFFGFLAAGFVAAYLVSARD